MAVDGDDGFIDVRNVLLNSSNKIAKLARGKVADGVGDVESCCACGDRPF